MVEFLVQVTNFELGLQVNLAIALSMEPVAGFLTALAHHDDRRLKGGDDFLVMGHLPL